MYFKNADRSFKGAIQEWPLCKLRRDRRKLDKNAVRSAMGPFPRGLGEYSNLILFVCMNVMGGF